VFPAPVVPFIREADFAVRPPWSMPNRRLLDYLLVGVEAGVVTLTVEGTAHELVPGDFALIQPRELHNFDAGVSTATPYLHLDVFYNARRGESFAIPGGRIDLTGYEHLIQPRLNDLPGIHIPTRFLPSDAERFREALLHTVTLAQSAGPFDMLEAQANATELIAMILRDFTAPAREALPPSSMHWITSYMSLRLGEQMTVADLAARAHLSPSRFAAVFRRQFGTSPHAYLTSLRVEHACSLLATTDATQTEIARLCGFADVPHFSKTFRRATGSTPGDYRDANRAHPLSRLEAPTVTGS
jgi:AraC-like DNA-binding protein